MNLISPVEKINRLLIQQLPSNKVIKTAAVCRYGRNTLILSADGRRVYASYAPKIAYTVSCKNDDLVLALHKIGYITAAEAKQHIETSATRRKHNQARNAARDFTVDATKLGVKLTRAQLKKLGAFDEAGAA